MLKRLWRSPAMLHAAGDLAALYLWFVRRTSRLVTETPTPYAQVEGEQPLIIAMWHGEHFLLPFARRPSDHVHVLISRSADGEINARVATRFGIGLIRGSGGPPRKLHRKGGAVALRAMIRTLEGGANVALTADVPKVARVVGEGIVQLARQSGRPIVPFAVCSQRRIRLNSWDRSAVPLPFGRLALVAGTPIRVGPEDDAASVEAARDAVARALDDVHARAYLLADGEPSGWQRA